MVKGLDVFKERFSDFSEQYVLIGGTACDLAMGAAGEAFRDTKDLDIVLCVEALNRAFVKTFWEFVHEGQYQVQEKASGKRQFYRFKKPGNDKFPFMLELFSRKPDALELGAGAVSTPVPIDDEGSSLSALLMEDSYYEFLNAGKKEVDGLPIVRPEHLIPLKARAWLDLKKRKESGEQIDGKDVKKHKLDVFRLYRIIDPEYRTEIPEPVKHDLRRFAEEVRSETVDLRNLGITEQSLEEVLAALRKIYAL